MEKLNNYTNNDNLKLLGFEVKFEEEQILITYCEDTYISGNYKSYYKKLDDLYVYDSLEDKVMAVMARGLKYEREVYNEIF